MLDLLFRRGNPTNNWGVASDQTLSIELLSPAINQILIGSQIHNLSFLGRSSSNARTPLEFAELGIALDHESDGSFSGFQIVLDDPSQTLKPYSGSILLGNSIVSPAALSSRLGTPYWVDSDEIESILFYEYPGHEIQIEQSLGGQNMRIVVTTMPLMADPEHRQSYGVDKAWPPS